MELISVLRLGSEDSHIQNRLRALENLTRIDTRDEHDPARRAFRRIRGGATALEDFRAALRGSLKAADEIAARAEADPCPYPEILRRGRSVEADWRGGLRRVPDLIRSEVTTIRDFIQDGCGVDLLASPKDEENR